MKISPVLIMPVVLSIASLWACAEHVTAVESSDADQELTLEGADDPFGVCDEHMTCSVPDTNCGGWLDSSGCPSGLEECVEEERYFIGCLHSCGTSADCPQPLSGDSTPVCLSGFCRLPCDSATCPNGYECVARNPPEFGSDILYPPQVCTQTFRQDGSAFADITGE